MIRKHNLIDLQQAIRAFDESANISLSDETALVHYGIVESTSTAHFDVGSRLFNKIAEATGNIVRNVNGRRELMFSHDVVIHEGPHLGAKLDNGIYVYPIESIQNRFKYKGDLRDLSLPKPVEKAVLEKPAEVILDQSNFSEAEIEFAARCKRADWYYSYSDDIRVYRAGKAQCEGLKKEADEKGGVFTTIYKYFSTK